MKIIKYLFFLMSSLVFVNVFGGQQRDQNSRLIIGIVNNRTPWSLRLVDKLNEDINCTLRPSEKQKLHYEVGRSKDIHKDTQSFSEESRFRAEARDKNNGLLVGKVCLNMAFSSEDPNCVHKMILNEGQPLYQSYGGIEASEKAKVDLIFSAKTGCVNFSQNFWRTKKEVDRLHCESKTSASELSD